MGQVWQATETPLDRDVAVRVLRRRSRPILDFESWLL